MNVYYVFIYQYNIQYKFKYEYYDRRKIIYLQKTIILSNIIHD